MAQKLLTIPFLSPVVLFQYNIVLILNIFFFLSSITETNQNKTRRLLSQQRSRVLRDHKLDWKQAVWTDGSLMPQQFVVEQVMALMTVPEENLSPFWPRHLQQEEFNFLLQSNLLHFYTLFLFVSLSILNFQRKHI